MIDLYSFRIRDDLERNKGGRVRGVRSEHWSVDHRNLRKGELDTAELTRSECL